MPACPRCGEPTDERARFCPACGTSLPATEATRAGVRKTVTVVFSDVTDWTGMGERHDPEQLRGVMDRYFAGVRSILERHGGTVEKFIGDAVMAVFGTPVVHEDDALRALRAVVELRDALAELNEELERDFGMRIAVRTGVTSGEVIAGDARGAESFVTGEAVNVAQRLQQAAAAGEILVGEVTYRLARDAVVVEALEPLAVKGKHEPVSAYRLLEVHPDAPGHAPRFESPIVGRSRERMLLADAFGRAVRESSCHLFTVLGPAGVGKSRLVAEVLAEIGDRATILQGSCLAYGEGITFWPVREIVLQATGLPGTTPRAFAPSSPPGSRATTTPRSSPSSCRGSSASEARSARPRRASGPCVTCSRSSLAGGRSSSSSTTSTGASRRSSTSSSTSPTGRGTRPSSSSASRAPSSSTCARPGAEGSSTPRRSSSSR